MLPEFRANRPEANNSIPSVKGTRYVRGSGVTEDGYVACLANAYDIKLKAKPV